MAVIGPIGMNVVSAASQRGGERRGNSLPREGLQPCVAPYFATRGRGDMRGGRGGVPPKSPPRRWWQAVASTMVLRTTCCVSRGWLVGSCGVKTAYHRLRGGIMRGGRGGVPPKSPPRRWCEAVAATMVAATASHHLRGGDLGGTPPRPPRMMPPRRRW